VRLLSTPYTLLKSFPVVELNVYDRSAKNYNFASLSLP
jgi:hypothetical protein